MRQLHPNFSDTSDIYLNIYVKISRQPFLHTGGAQGLDYYGYFTTLELGLGRIPNNNESNRIIGRRVRIEYRSRSEPNTPTRVFVLATGLYHVPKMGHTFSRSKLPLKNQLSCVSLLKMKTIRVNLSVYFVRGNKEGHRHLKFPQPLEAATSYCFGR